MLTTDVVIGMQGLLILCLAIACCSAVAECERLRQIVRSRDNEHIHRLRKNLLEQEQVIEQLETEVRDLRRIHGVDTAHLNQH